jgi:hypothetical protein
MEPTRPFGPPEFRTRWATFTTGVTISPRAASGSGGHGKQLTRVIDPPMVLWTGPQPADV